MTKPNPPIPSDIVEATKQSVTDAYEDGKLATRHNAAVSALYVAAAKLERIRTDFIEGNDNRDNTTFAAYTKLLNELGLTPLGQKQLDDKKVKTSGKLSDTIAADRRAAKSQAD